MFIGALLGLCLTYVLFTNVSWYHDFTVWCWTNPWAYVIGGIGGITFAIIELTTEQ